MPAEPRRERERVRCSQVIGHFAELQNNVVIRGVGLGLHHMTEMTTTGHFHRPRKQLFRCGQFSVALALGDALG